MCTRSIGNKSYMLHDFHIKQPMQMINLKKNKKTYETPHLNNAIERSVKHLFGKKIYSKFPFPTS